MLAKEFKKIMDSGIQPIIEYTDLVNELEVDPDERMRCRAISCSEPDNDGVMRFICDFNGFEEYNKIFAKVNWFDKDRQPTLTWFETNFYPKDGMHREYITSDYEVHFKIVEENELYNEFLNEETNQTYVQWLESEIIKLRNK